MSHKIKHFDVPSIRITIRYCLIAFILVLLVAFSLPFVLNYGPESINSDFDVQMSYISYTQQFILITLVAVLVLYLITKFCLKDIDNWYRLDDKDKYSDTKLINKIRKQCFNLPYIIFLIELIVPLIFIVVFLSITGSHGGVMIFKVTVFIASLSFALAVCSYTFAKDIYSDVLSKTYSKDPSLGYRVSLRKKVFLQILPLFLTGVFITALVGYSRTVSEKEDIYFSVYSKTLSETFDTSETYTMSEVISLLADIELYDTSSHSIFVITANEQLVTLSGPEVSNFVKEYTIQLSDKYDGRTYDSYGVDAQGATIKLQTDEGIIYVGILYDITSTTSLVYFLICIVVLLCIAIFVLYLFGKSLSKDLTNISDGFNSIYKNNEEITTNLPVVSNDEIGDLVIGFNKIQKQQQMYLQTIKDNQNMLMERERLASLGQLIGGIAHNLKTPIMSISGAAEGLNDLIKEYDSSIGDSDVTNEDHHAIAKDMLEWTNKIKDYTEYMSDIITAVKGQAVTLTDEQSMSFDIEELIKRVNILMKHELKNALIKLNFIINVDSSITLHGNINSLVQVVNNMISNAIQAYNGKTNEEIDFIVDKNQDTIVISIKDYADGLSQEVQDKLFKEMITTKGKNGTGLGLFMSYSTIRAHFNGNITFETEKGKGTVFHIILPI